MDAFNALGLVYHLYLFFLLLHRGGTLRPVGFRPFPVPLCETLPTDFHPLRKGTSRLGRPCESLWWSSLEVPFPQRRPSQSDDVSAQRWPSLEVPSLNGAPVWRCPSSTAPQSGGALPQRCPSLEVPFLNGAPVWRCPSSTVAQSGGAPV